MSWLVDEWKQSWKWGQTWLGVLIAAAPELYNQWVLLQTVLPPQVARYGVTVLGVLVMLNAIRKKPV